MRHLELSPRSGGGGVGAVAEEGAPPAPCGVAGPDGRGLNDDEHQPRNTSPKTIVASHVTALVRFLGATSWTMSRAVPNGVRVSNAQAAKRLASDRVHSACRHGPRFESLPHRRGTFSQPSTPGGAWSYVAPDCRRCCATWRSSEPGLTQCRSPTASGDAMDITEPEGHARASPIPSVKAPDPFRIARHPRLDGCAAG